MFGYVSPYKMELKIKDFEKFKAYYCGLCVSIKNSFGNLPRFSLNYDMAFLGVLLDSLEDKKNIYIKNSCIAHPFKKRVIIINSSALDYAAFCNVCLTYYKLLDDFHDDISIKSKILSQFLNIYLKGLSQDKIYIRQYIENKLRELSILEKAATKENLDVLSHPFADLTGFILSAFVDNNGYKLDLYWLGYNLGKWIYIIDAYDDLEKDLLKKKFNPINSALNHENLDYSQFKNTIEERIDFTLASCARECYEYYLKLPIKKNHDILDNILHYGLVQKMNLVFKRSVCENEKSL
ncbi:hypothetical protein CLHOM_09200 [Clostridium homopropionicum DSM 5847]|uniref:Uncharacterized protein n=1 Tax=Clostridium homopropionicum DSM 5847 TaxID=1121318 RepID=A0A0L6ZDC0_9CLOT|nr:DUF5685 family protein [Clostridium homopropionicum]KOA20778.1 hypothetical protein CLHOM_09200 [Clostridium homopropionicum DSM 5847]SFF89378.1 hypothetical protein SAMN04488501_10380 [Clostridium homopropionicum]